MSILVPLLLSVLALSACQASAATLPHTSVFLKESIQLLDGLLEPKVSCDKMNVTNIFAGDKHDNIIETLCQATTVALEGQSCHTTLGGIYLNLLHFIQRKSPTHKVPCPVAPGNTTTLHHFIVDLRRVLQQLVKQQGWE